MNAPSKKMKLVLSLTEEAVRDAWKCGYLAALENIESMRAAGRSLGEIMSDIEYDLIAYRKAVDE